jgi:hypothetical protein
MFKAKRHSNDIHRLYSDKQDARKRIEKIKELGYKNTVAIDLGDSGIRIQEIWCYHCILHICILHFHTANKTK